MKESKTTSIDIAYRAGVSQATVSRALRDSPLVNAKTRARIQRIARELNYKVDRNAASLRSQQSKTIALLLFEDPTTDESHINPFFLAMLGNITRAAAEHGYDVLVSFQQLSDDWHAEYEASNRADGIILLGYGDYVTYGEKLSRLTDAGAHFMIWGPMIRSESGSSLGCDNFQGACDATRHLLNLGRKRIAFLGEASAHCPEFKQRYEGYESAHRLAGVEVDAALRVDAESQEKSGYDAATSLLKSGAEFDGIIAASDLIAIGAIRACQDWGLRIPQDIGVMGFDDIPAASYFRPALSTVHQDTRRAGKLLVSNLIKLIRGEPVESGLLESELVIRSSCGAKAAGNPES